VFSIRVTSQRCLLISQRLLFFVRNIWNLVVVRLVYRCHNLFIAFSYCVLRTASSQRCHTDYTANKHSANTLYTCLFGTQRTHVCFHGLLHKVHWKDPAKICLLSLAAFLHTLSDRWYPVCYILSCGLADPKLGAPKREPKLEENHATPKFRAGQQFGALKPKLEQNRHVSNFNFKFNQRFGQA